MNKVVLKGKNYEGIVSFTGKDFPDVLKLSLKKDAHEQFYNDFYQNNHLQKIRKYQSVKLIRKLRSYIFSSKSILEIGCGSGIFIDELLKIYKGEVLGIDPCLKIETKNKKKYDLYEFNEKKFDCIILLDVFEHFEENMRALGKITSLLSEKGYLILKVPNKNSLFYKISKIISIFNKSSLERLYQIDFPPQHFFYYNEKSLRKLCENAGFKYMSHFYMTEVPLKGLYERLWGLSPIIKILAVPFVFLYNIVAFGFLKDSLIVCFDKYSDEKINKIFET